MGVLDQDKFLSVCRVSSGYTDHQLEGLTQKLSNLVISRQDPDVDYGKAKPDVFFNPRLAPVVQVKAAEIIASDTYATNVTSPPCRQPIFPPALRGLLVPFHSRIFL